MKPRKSTRPPKVVYRVVANIDSMFPDLDTAFRAHDGLRVYPTVPETASIEFHEDRTTPRICVAGRLEDCFTAIGLLGRFRRCLSANRDAMSYANSGNEVYPVLVQAFDGSLAVRPTREQVPDWPWTNEFWIPEPAMPLKTSVAWLGMYSIKMQEIPETDEYPCLAGAYACKSVDFVQPDPAVNVHPWLNGKGHVLASSEFEED